MFVFLNHLYICWVWFCQETKVVIFGHIWNFVFLGVWWGLCMVPLQHRISALFATHLQSTTSSKFANAKYSLNLSSLLAKRIHDSHILWDSMGIMLLTYSNFMPLLLNSPENSPPFGSEVWSVLGFLHWLYRVTRWLPMNTNSCVTWGYTTLFALTLLLFYDSPLSCIADLGICHVCHHRLVSRKDGHWET